MCAYLAIFRKQWF